MQEWIAYRLCLLFADKRGRIVMGARLGDRSARVALFLDLVLRGRLVSGDDGSSLDTTPTGFAPADALLRYVDDHPTGTLYDAFTSAPVRVRDVVDAAADPAGGRRRRGGTVDPAAATAERALVRSLGDSMTGDAMAVDAGTATLVALADALGLATVDALPQVFARCGPAAAVIGDCCTYLIQVKDGLAGISGLLNSSSAGI